MSTEVSDMELREKHAKALEAVSNMGGANPLPLEVVWLNAFTASISSGSGVARACRNADKCNRLFTHRFRSQ